MTFPHTEMDLDQRLAGVLGGQRKSFLSYMAQQPSEILKGQGELKRSQKDPAEETRVDEGHWVPAKKGNPGSFLIKPSDRDKFINWGKKKAKKKIQEGLVTLRQELEVLRPQLAAAAQQIYDTWDPNDEGLDAVYGGGGPCDEIAAAMSGIIGDSIDAHVDDGGHDGDDHAFLIVSRAGERYWVDIPPSVQVRPEDVIIEPI